MNQKKESTNAADQLIGTIQQIADIMQSEQSLREISTNLLIRMAGAILEIQVRLGMFKEAKELSDAFAIGAAALRLQNEREAAEEEE